MPTNKRSTPENTTVLLIDDDPALLKTLEATLRAKGFRTLAADNGLHGLELARAQSPDLIISDIQMELGDGYSVLETLRREPATLAIPLILMTGMASSESMRHGMELGADDYLAKPFSQKELLAAIQGRLDRHRALAKQAQSKLDDLRMKLSLMLPHELKTPLTAVLSLGEQLKSYPGELTPSELSSIGTHLVQAGERLRRLIQNFLLYSETELLLRDSAQAARLKQPERFAVLETIETVARAVAQRHRRPGDLRLELAASLYARISPELLAKTLDELLDNAFKFSRPGSTVVVRGSVKDQNMLLSITDKGCGMRPAQITGVGAFVQFDREAREQQGTGLGLTLARRITALHQGNLTIQSQPDQGTTMQIRLPAQQDRK